MKLLLVFILLVPTLVFSQCEPEFPEYGPWDQGHCSLEAIQMPNVLVNQPDNLTLYLSSENENGWEGSFIEITISDDEDTLVTYLTTFISFEIVTFPITNGQNICINYTSFNPDLDEFNGLTIFNCSGGNLVFNGSLSSGEIWCGEADCNLGSFEGEWSICSDNAGSFSDPDIFETLFTPEDYGEYVICFAPNCNNEIYEFEFSFLEECGCYDENACNYEINTEVPIDCDYTTCLNIDFDHEYSYYCEETTIEITINSFEPQFLSLSICSGTGLEPGDDCQTVELGQTYQVNSSSPGINNFSFKHTISPEQIEPTNEFISSFFVNGLAETPNIELDTDGYYCSNCTSVDYYEWYNNEILVSSEEVLSNDLFVTGDQIYLKVGFDLDFETCEYSSETIVNIEEPVRKDFQLLRNGSASPALTSLENLNYQIFDAKGSLLKLGSLNTGETVTFENMKAGFYLIRVKNSSVNLLISR